MLFKDFLHRISFLFPWINDLDIVDIHGNRPRLDQAPPLFFFLPLFLFLFQILRTSQHSTVLCCTVLYYTVQKYLSVLYCTVLCKSTLLYCVKVPYCTVMYCMKVLTCTCSRSSASASWLVRWGSPAAAGPCLPPRPRTCWTPRAGRRRGRTRRPSRTCSGRDSAPGGWPSC